MYITVDSWYVIILLFIDIDSLFIEATFKTSHIFEALQYVELYHAKSHSTTGVDSVPNKTKWVNIWAWFELFISTKNLLSPCIICSQSILLHKRLQFKLNH